MGFNIDAAGFSIAGTEKKEETQKPMTQNIEGIPTGWKLLKIGAGKVGDWVLDWEGTPYQADYEAMAKDTVIVAPDNVYNTALSEVAIPAGYVIDRKMDDKVGDWFREPKAGEPCVSRYPADPLYHWDSSYFGVDNRRIILRPIKPKTKRVLVMETEDAGLIESYRQYLTKGLGEWSVRIEERAV